LLLEIGIQKGVSPMMSAEYWPLACKPVPRMRKLPSGSASTLLQKTKLKPGKGKVLAPLNALSR
jgi:hypothetical protein